MRHWSWAMRSASSSVSAHDTCTCTATGLPSPPCSRKAASTRSSCSRGWLIVISPSAHSPAKPAVSALTAVAEQRRRLGGQRPQLRAVDGDQPVVVDDLAREQRADHVDALAQPGVARRLARPRLAGDVLVENSPVPSATDRRPGEHLGQRGGGLRDDRRVVALPGRVDDPVRHRRRLHRGAEPRPREAGLALALAPGREVVGATRRAGSPRPPPRASPSAARSGGICSCDAWMPIGRHRGCSYPGDANEIQALAKRRGRRRGSCSRALRRRRRARLRPRRAGGRGACRATLPVSVTGAAGPATNRRVRAR